MFANNRGRLSFRIFTPIGFPLRQTLPATKILELIFII